MIQYYSVIPSFWQINGQTNNVNYGQAITAESQNCYQRHIIVLERYRFGLAGLIGTLKFVSVFVAESIIAQSGELS